MLDISNATAAGPSYGLLDVIFGKKPEEEPAEGKFDGLMGLIKGMNEAKKEVDSAKGAAASWTEKETGTGKDAIDYRFASIPSLYTMLNPELQAQLAKQAVQDGQAADVKLAAGAAAGNPAAVKALHEKMELVANSSPQMRQLYEAAKIVAAEKAMAQASPAQKVQGSPEMELNGVEQLPAEAALAKELAARGIDVQDASAKAQGPHNAKAKDGLPVKSMEAKGAPDKLVSTESYLQMHQMAKGPKVAKELPESAPKADGVRLDKAAAMTAAGEAKTGDKVSDVAAKQDGKSDADQLIGNKEKNLNAQKHMEGKADFAPTLDRSMQGAAAGLAVKNVYLAGHKPEHVREGLLNEVAQSVHAQAVKGGGEMKMIIHPEALGELRLKVGTTKDGKVEVSVSAENEEVAGILRKGSHDLANSLSDQNLTLSKFEVTVSDKTVTASQDSKGGMMEQFLQQRSHQSAFGFMNGDDGRSSSGYRNMVRDEEETVSRINTAGVSKNQRAKSSQNRLDVVA